MFKSSLVSRVLEGHQRWKFFFRGLAHKKKNSTKVVIMGILVVKEFADLFSDEG